MKNRITGLLGVGTPWEIEWRKRFESPAAPDVASSPAADPAELLAELERLFPGDEEKRARALVSGHPDDDTPETKHAFRRALVALTLRSPLDARGALSYLTERARAFTNQQFGESE